MTKAIHLINEREGLSRKGLTLQERATDTWRSCCWLLSGEEQDALLGGWLYLHDAKAKPASFAGQILGFEPAKRDGAAIEDGVAILFRADRSGRDQKWRGASHAMAWSSGVIDGDLPHERG